MDKTKHFKSIYIHNGCRNSKVIPFKKLSFCKKIEKIVQSKIQYLIDINLSLMDAEIQKGSLFGKEYFKTLLAERNKILIELNDLRIQINIELLKLFVKFTKKLKIYD